jgi:protein tyrosine phosphatase (PTP) superfamily phosphohydrolase (DUF442 family)
MRSRILTYTRVLGAALALPVLASLAFAPSGAATDDRPAVVESSAGPIPLPGNAVLPSVMDSKGPIQIPGVAIKNFGVVDGRIFRGEQPRGDEYAELARLGVKTLIDLRLDAKPDSKSLAEAAGLRYVNIPIDDHEQPTDDNTKVFLSVVRDPDAGPVYVHCAGGRHRTGSMVALYRMIQDGWTADQAYDEMLAYDFYTARGHKGFKTYVFDYYARMQADPTSVPLVYVAPAPDGTVAVSP